MQTQIKPEVKREIRSLAFNTVKVGGGLYAAQIIKYEGNRIIGVRTGNGTSFGHATSEAGDLMTHFHLYEFENGPDKFFSNVRMV